MHDVDTAEPVTRDELLAALVYQSEHRLQLQASGAPHEALVRAARRIDHLLDRLGAFDG